LAGASADGKLIARYLNPHEFPLDGPRRVDLLADVQAFQKASLAGEYAGEAP
jgi:hypothetical protein